MPIRWASQLLSRKSGGPPVIGYRAWCFSLDRVTPLIPLRWAPMALFPTADLAETIGETGWTGAESGWVSATCWRSSRVPEKIGGRCPCRQQVALGLRGSPCFDCDPHRVPGVTCSCGFYAMKSLDALGTHRGERHPRKDRDGREGDRPRVRLSRGARADLGLDPTRRHRDRREGVVFVPVPSIDEVCATLAASGSNRLNARARVRARAGRRGST